MKEMTRCSEKTEGLTARLTMENQGEYATLQVVVPPDVWKELTSVCVVAAPHADDMPEVEAEPSVLTKRPHGVNRYIRSQRIMTKGIPPSPAWPQTHEYFLSIQELWMTPGKSPPNVFEIDQMKPDIVRWQSTAA